MEVKTLDERTDEAGGDAVDGEAGELQEYVELLYLPRHKQHGLHQ